MKVYVQRDFSEGTKVQFQEKFPLELEGKIPRNLFLQTVQNINKFFVEAERTDKAAYLTGMCACLTGFLVYACFDTHYQKCMKRMAHYVQEQNDTVFQSRGLVLIDPMERGLRVIEVNIENHHNPIAALR